MEGGWEELRHCLRSGHGCQDSQKKMKNIFVLIRSGNWNDIIVNICTGSKH